MGWPREQVLNVPIACRRYGPSKSSSLPSTDGSFTLTASMTVLREKLGTNSMIVQPTCRGLCREPFFWSSCSVHRCWRFRERLLCIDRVRYVWSGTICGLSVGCVWHVGPVSPAGCTSIRITAMRNQLGVEALKSRYVTSHLRAQCEPCIRRVSLFIVSTVFLKLEHFTIMNYILYSKNLCDNSLLCGLCIYDILLCNYYFCNNTPWWSWWE
jgi:hypothetical protein